MEKIDQKGFVSYASMFFLVLTLVVVILAYLLIRQQAPKTHNSRNIQVSETSQPSITTSIPSPTSSPITPISVSLEKLRNFPVNSKATFVGQEYIPPCEQPEWLSYCNVDVYTWSFETFRKEESNWFLNESKKAGFNCMFGDTYVSANSQTECTKGNYTYGFKLKKEGSKTLLILSVPR